MIFTNAKISPKWTVNIADLKKVGLDTLRFFSVPLSMYLVQLTGTLSNSGILLWKDLLPSLVTIGAIEGWALGIAVNFFLKLSNGNKK